MDVKKLGFDTINLGHGSGGLMTRDLLDKIIFDMFNNPYLNQKVLFEIKLGGFRIIEGII